MNIPNVHGQIQHSAVGTISLISNQINYVQKHIDKVTKYKESVIQELETKMRKLRQAAGDGMSATLLQEQIQEMMANHSDLLGEINRIATEAMKEKKAIDIMAEAVTIMDREVARIQADHDRGVFELRQKREKLKTKLQSILEVDEMIVGLEGKMRKEMEQHNTDLEVAEASKDVLIRRDDVDPEEKLTRLQEVDEEIIEINKKYKLDMDFMKKQKLDVEIESAAIMQNMEKTLEELFVGGTEDYLEEINRLEDLKLHTSPSKQESFDRAILFYRSRITEEELRQNMTIIDRIHEFLKKHDMVMLDNGEIQCADETILTLSMARQRGLLDELDKHIVESCGLQCLDINRVLAPDGRVLTREQAQKCGLLEKYDLPAILFAEESIRSDLSSRDSEFISEDAFYLKKYLGVPLTLALAEITAKQPADPIHYLGHWLFKYRYNQEIEQSKKQDVIQLTNMRDKIAKDKWTQFLEDEARKTILDIVNRAETEGDKNEFERELQRIADETDAMENDEDQDALEEEARDTLGEYKGPTVNQRGSTRAPN